MSDRNQEQQLVELFMEAGHAHHQAYLDTDGADPEWPLWYATFLKEKLSDRFGYETTKSNLVYLLVHAEKEHSRNEPDTHWTIYYARLFMACFNE